MLITTTLMYHRLITTTLLTKRTRNRCGVHSNTDTTFLNTGHQPKVQLHTKYKMYDRAVSSQ